VATTDITVPVPEEHVADFLKAAAEWLDKANSPPRTEPYSPPDGISPWSGERDAALIVKVFDDLPWSAAEIVRLLIDADGQAVRWDVLAGQVGLRSCEEVAQAIVTLAKACHTVGRRVPIGLADGGAGPNYWFDRALSPHFRAALERAQDE
jgi:hypothetical protein